MTSPVESNGAVTVSDQLFAPISPGVELCYQTFGDPAGEPLLLVMGLGGPMTWWAPDLCEALVHEGFYVVRFDNRDVGRSSRARGRVSRTAIVRAFVGAGTRPPYTISDMAADAFGLLDHLGLGSAHVAGVSMGGMIVQTMAVSRPERVRSLTSIMSTTGKRTVGWQHPSLLTTLTRSGSGKEAYVRSSHAIWAKIGSPDFPSSVEENERRAEETFDHGVSAAGTLRQVMAILTQPDRTEALHSLRMPATVVHGLADKMVHVSGGRATAAAIPGSELLLVDGMGHDLPAALQESFVGAIRRTADRATTAGR